MPEHNPHLKHQILVIADEFTAMGKVSILSKAISYIAGYGIRMMPIIQSPAQLREVYGHDASETFMENHALHILFAPKNIKNAEEIAKNIGTHTVKNISRSKQLIGKSSLSESKSDYGRYLLLPQEIKQIGQDKELILLENCPPILADKIKWYDDEIFKSRGNPQGKPIIWQLPIIPLINPDNRPMGKIAYMKKTELGAGERKETALKENENSQNTNALNVNITENSVSPTSSNTNTLSEQDLKTIAECYDFEGLL